MAASTSGRDSARAIHSDFLSGQLSSDQRRLYLVVLNYELPSCVPLLWKQATYRICADGGANRLYDLMPSLLATMEPQQAQAHLLPDVLLGDLDSVRPEVREFYSTRGVPIEDLSADQDSTDLTKCVQHIQKHFISNSPELDHEIIAVGGLGGRLDHTLGNLNTLHMFPHLAITLIGDGNMVRLVRPGRSVIHVDRRYQGPTCGLVPLRAPATVTTTGLRWNCEALYLAIGGLISTSNVLEADEVTMETDGDLLWSTELREPPNEQ